MLDFACMTLLGGAIAKSAQIGLHTWLPDAMEGPSPVSALIHAATMVTAGVYLVVRFSPVIEYSYITKQTCLMVGAITAFFASTTALFQNDIKRVIAYSTCSQLGYMMFACGLSGYDFAMAHLFNHAFFKALLFLSAGAIIHALEDEQDMRRMGGSIENLILSYTCILFASMSLLALPFTTGFYSKDGILELAFATATPAGYFAYILGLTAAFFTALYSTRLICLTFFGSPRGFREHLLHSHDANLEMALVMYILIIPTVIIGHLTNDLFVGVGTNFWGNAILILPENFVSDIEFIPTGIKILPLIFSLIGIMLGFGFYYFNPTLLDIKYKYYNIYLFFNYKWLFDPLYNAFIAKPVLWFGHRVTFEILDRGFFEWVGPYGLAKIITRLVSIAQKMQSGYLYHYIFLIVIGLIILVSLIYISITMFDPQLQKILFISIFLILVVYNI